MCCTTPDEGKAVFLEMLNHFQPSSASTHVPTLAVTQFMPATEKVEKGSPDSAANRSCIATGRHIAASNDC